MINLDFLEYLIEFSKTNNLTKTSKSLHISQSALTRAMQKVEDYVGVPIFTHSKNKLELNDAGQVLVKYAKIVLDAEKIMKEKTVTFHNSSISLSIGSIAPGPMIKWQPALFTLSKQTDFQQIGHRGKSFGNVEGWQFRHNFHFQIHQ